MMVECLNPLRQNTSLSMGTASASLPRQGVCRRCPQRTVLVGLHRPPFFRGLRTRAVPIGVFVFCLREYVFDTISHSTYNQRLIEFLPSQKERYSKLRKNARLIENTNRFSTCNVMPPKLSLSYGKRNSLKTPQRALFAHEEAEAFPMESEFFPQRRSSTHLQ